MTDTTSWDTVQADVPRDRWDRPLIMQPATGKRKAYRRCTTFVGVLEDTYKLQEWERRVVALGMGQRPDLVLGAHSLTLSKDDQKSLQKIADTAKEVGGGSSAATTGTALHKLCERKDRGETLGRVPDPYGADLKAYDAEMKRFGIEHKAIESFRIFDDWAVAGTTDRIVKINGRYYIADIKTGRIDFGIMKILMQLAMYRHSVPYDVRTDERGVDPYTVEADKALIIHLPAGEGVCELHWVDIRLGWKFCGIAKQVWDARGTARDKMTWPALEQTELIPHEDLRASAHESFIQKALSANTIDELKSIWNSGRMVNHDTEDFTAAVKRRKAQLLGAE